MSAYLFEGGFLRTRAFDLASLRALIERNSADLGDYVGLAFRQGWPESDAEVTRPEALLAHVLGFVGELQDVIHRLGRRLRWAMDQIKRLNAVREQQGDLEPEDESLFRRCDALVKRLKGTSSRRRREAEGYDDSNTYGVLAAEGFLPGYGLEVGSVLGTACLSGNAAWAAFFGAGKAAVPRRSPLTTQLRAHAAGRLRLHQ